jgi:transposase
VVVHAKIRDAGYGGGISILRDYIRPRRVLRRGRETVRFETPPGRQMQSDWGEIWTEVAGRRTKVHFMVNTLGYSRRFHFWCTDSEDSEHTYEGLIRSFEHFGGVTEEVLTDNLKAAVVSHSHSGRVVYNERFLDLATHYGFRPRACRPYRARTKGKDERMVGYIKGNFFQRYRSFESLEQMNRLAEKWLSEEADQRVQGTMKEKVRERFEREKSSLGALPQRRYDTSYRQYRTVGWDGYIDVGGNRYSVPDVWCAKTVGIRISLDGLLRVYSAEGEKIAEHRLRGAEEGWVKVPGHHEGLWKRTMQVQQRDLGVYEEVVR